jgi:hypothetical protein
MSFFVCGFAARRPVMGGGVGGSSKFKIQN